MSDNSVPSRLSYASAARLAQGKTTPSTSSTSVSSSKPGDVVEEYPSLVPQTTTSHQNHTASINDTTIQSSEGKVSPRRWETVNADRENSYATVTAPPSEAPTSSKSASGAAVGPSGSNNGVFERSAEPKQQPRWADLLKKPSAPDQAEKVAQPQNSRGLAGNNQVDRAASNNSSMHVQPPAGNLDSGDHETIAQEAGVEPLLTDEVQPFEGVNIRVSNAHSPQNDGVQHTADGVPVDNMVPDMPPPMYPVNPQYGFMVPGAQYASQQVGGNFFVPNPYYQPMGMMQMPYQQHPYYNGIVAEQRMDGSVVYRYPPYYDNDNMYPANNQAQQYQQPVFDQVPAYVSLPRRQQPAPPGPRRDDSWGNAVAKMEEAHRIREKINLLIANRYRVLQKINMGSCGSIYTALDTESKDNTVVAVKFEIYKETESHLLYEYEVYKNCTTYVDEDGEVKGKPAEGFGKVLWMGTQFGYRVLVMQLLGPSLENLFSFSFKKLSPETVYKLGMQMIDRIEHLHNCGYVHRDMKPDNFVVGLGENENTVFLLDFGLARRVIYNKNNKPSNRRGRGLVGTAKYASINSHRGLELAPRDDMESICYILLEFITGEVPWKNRNKKLKHPHFNRMRQIKEEFNWEQFCPELAPWMEYVRSVQFNDKPDYDNFRRYLRLFLERSQAVPKSPLNDHLAQMNLGEPFQRRHHQRRSLRNNYHNNNNNGGNRLSATCSKSEQQQLTVEQRLEQNTFEWVARRTSSHNETYTYQCLFMWTLPLGTEPERPPDRNPSMQFGYGFGEGGFA